MPLRELVITELGAFSNVKLEFGRGINVFIGPNGTGKTHVLKLLYACTEALRRAPDATGARLSSELRRKLSNVFKPDGGKVGRLVRRKQGLNKAHVSLRGFGTEVSKGRLKTARESLTFSIHTKGNFDSKVSWFGARPRSVYLPTREVLAMYEGFIHAYQERELSFDETYFDLCVALNANPLRGTRASAAESVVERIRDALGGHVEERGGRFYVKFHGDRARMEAQLVAEGLRKIASLERLVLNGSLMKHGYLMWDEPEANLNPRLISMVVDVLGQLAREGIQIFLATHDYLLARRLSIAAERGVPTRFFSFYRERPAAPVSVEGRGRFEELEHNPLAEELARLYEEGSASEP